MKKQVSLKDIAQKVGVSTALVSYVLNNKKEGRIGKEVAKRIKEVAIELNYRTNFIAKSLKTNKTFTIGLIVSNISNSFSSSLARIIEDEADKYNYTVLFGSSDESVPKSLKLINVLLNHQVDGLIIAPAENSESQLHYLKDNDIPFVLIDRYFPGCNACHVAIDNYKAAYKAVQHLIDNGSKRIGMIGFQSSLFHLQERNKGYLTALEDNGIIIQNEWVITLQMQHTADEVSKAIDDLLSLPEPVNAILFASNTLSTSGLKYINTLDIKVPDDLAIVSFDQSDAADIFYAPLTHIKQPLNEMGSTAIKMLLDIIAKKENVEKVNMEAELIVGTSSLKNKA